MAVLDSPERGYWGPAAETGEIRHRGPTPALALMLVLVAATGASDPAVSVGQDVLSPEASAVTSQVAGSGSADGALVVPYFPSASDPLGRQGFVRVVNLSDRDGTIEVDVFDDSGRSYGPVTLSIDALQTAHFNSNDLEDGNANKGLSAGVGRPAQGDWRLELTSGLDVNVLAYIRTSDGFLTSMHDVARSDGDTHHVAIFNPGSNMNQESLLRLVNPGTEEAEVTVTGVDDAGESPGAPVVLRLAAGQSCTVDAAQLESGSGLACGDPQAGLGDGHGKWRLEVETTQPVMAMSLLSSPTGHLTNLSTDPGDATDSGGSSGSPDLVVESPSVDDDTLETGDSFRLSATVRNRGDATADATTLRYFRSSNATISTGDTEVGTDSVSGLAAGASGDESISLTAPSSAGTYYYGACVDSVSGESNTSNNCSDAVQVQVSAGGGGGVPSHPRSTARFSPPNFRVGESVDLIVSWSRVSGAADYKVYINNVTPILYSRRGSVCSVTSSTTRSATTTGTSYTYTFRAGLINNYYYFVQACSSSGDCSCPNASDSAVSVGQDVLSPEASAVTSQVAGSGSADGAL